MKSALLYSFTFLILGCTMSTNNSIVETNKKSSTNPFFEKSKLYMGFPPFDLIKNEHYLPAFLKGMSKQLDEIDLIAKKIQKAKTDAFDIPEKKEELIDRPEAENLLTIFSSLTNKSLDETIKIFCGSDFKLSLIHI